MCGFLIYPEKPSRNLLAKHLEQQKHRGTDGYGAIALQPPTSKGARHVKDLNHDTFMDSFMYMPRQPTIIHHRKASIGGIKAELVHPVSDSANKVFVMHNGTRKALSDMFWGQSDTCVIADFWNIVGDEAMWCMLERTGVVFVYDEGKLWFHKDIGRSLHLCTEGIAKGMYASEPMEEGMWAAIDSHILTELPLDMAEWDLGHDDPEGYRRKVCTYQNCGEEFIGLSTTVRCSDCKGKTQYSWPPDYTQGRANGKVRKWVAGQGWVGDCH
jgi:hypothetical protein